MERLDIPATYQKPTRQQPTIPIYESDDWFAIPYRPRADCPLCRGAGFVHPRERSWVIYGKAIPCVAAGCLRDSVVRHLTGVVAVQTFDNFVPVTGTKAALKAAQALASGQSDFVWLLIYGAPGSGKTHLCKAMVKELRDRGQDVRMILAGDFFSLLREGMKDNRTDEILRKLKEVFFLAVDDYGVEYGSDWEMSKFDELMTSRFALARPTVVVTNKDLADLPDRVRSRFQDKLISRAIHNSAPDYRGLKR